MTVSTTESQIDYTGNGATVFAIPFLFLANGDLVLTKMNANDVVTTLVLGSDYTLSGAGNPSGGTATLTAPLTTGNRLRIARSMVAVQETDLRNQGKFYQQTIEDAFDYVTLLIQQYRTAIANSMQKSIGGLFWDALGLVIRNVGTPVKANDATTKNYVDTNIANIGASSNAYTDAKIAKTVRTPENIGSLPGAPARAGMLMGFDAGGNPVPVAPAGGPVTDASQSLWSRHSLSSAIANVHQALDAQAVSVWEFAGLIADKPTADPATWDWTPAIQAALDSGAPVVTVPSCRVVSQLLINDGQTVYLDGDILVDWYTPLGPAARVRDVMQASLFANKRGLATALAFIGDGTFSSAINASGKFLPNQNHNATDNGERGIKIIQRVGRIYSNRARYTPDTGPYAAVVLCITEQCDIQLSRVENMGAGMFAYHALSNRVALNGKNIGTDYRGTTLTSDLLAGSYGCVYLGKALNWDNEIHAIGQNCNDVLTLDGICRGNKLISVSWEDSTDPGARNNRVLELSDNCRGNDGRVTASGGGRYEHVVMQDGCSSNTVTLLSQDSAGRCVTIKRNCFSNSIVVNARNWAAEATGVGAVELVQSNSQPGCGGNAFDLQLFHPTGGRKAIVELLTDSNLPHLNNDYRVKLGYGSGAVTYTFASPDGMIQAGSLLEGAATESVSIMGQSSAMAAASTYLIAPLGQSGLTSIRPVWDCQVRGLRVSGNGTFTAGSIQVLIEVFRGGIWVSLDEIAMTPTGQDALREYRDRFACYCNVPLESLRVRAVTSADFVGTGFTLLYALSLSRTL